MWKEITVDMWHKSVAALLTSYVSATKCHWTRATNVVNHMGIVFNDPFSIHLSPTNQAIYPISIFADSVLPTATHTVTK